MTNLLIFAAACFGIFVIVKGGFFGFIAERKVLGIFTLVFLFPIFFLVSLYYLFKK